MVRLSYRNAFRPYSRVSSGKTINTYLNMQRYKTAIKIWKQKLVAILNHETFKHAMI